MSDYFGDIDPSDSIRFPFNTRDTDGAPITLDSGAIRVYKDDGTTEDDSGITLNTDFDGKVGLHLVEIDTSADATFYSAGADFTVVLSAGTVDTVSVTGVCVGAFSIQNRSHLRPTTAGRTLDVSAGGEAGVDWANVGSPTTTLNLSGTTVKTATDVETDTQDIQSRLPATLTGGLMRSDSLAWAGGATQYDSLPVVQVNLINTNVIDATAVAASAVTEIQSGLATAAELAKVPKSDSNVTWNATAAAQIQSEANDALVANNLDHLVLSAVDTNFATTVHVDSVIGQMAQTADGGYDRSTDSLEAGRDNIGTAGAGLTAADDAVVTLLSSTGVILTSAYDFAKGTVAMTEAYNTDGAAPTPAQALFVIMQSLTEGSISGTTWTVKKLDGSTTALTITLNDASTPTSKTRSG